MKILFLDDCLRGDKKYFGHGGFAVDEKDVSGLCQSLWELKRHFRIPAHVELKWSPDRTHFLRTNFKGDRQQLYADMISLLRAHNASVISAVHNLSDCYGVKNYGWDINRAVLWATKQQLAFIAERFELPYLKMNDEIGIIIADKYSERKAEAGILKDTYDVMNSGTQYRKFKRICINPLLAISEFCPPLQLADTVIGIIVAALSNSPYGQCHFDNLAPTFFRNPFTGAQSFTSLYSAAVLGYGLVLFPKSFRPKACQIFKKLDEKFIRTEKGLIGRDKPPVLSKRG